MLYFILIFSLVRYANTLLIGVNGSPRMCRCNIQLSTYIAFRKLPSEELTDSNSFLLIGRDLLGDDQATPRQACRFIFQDLFS